MEAPTFPRSDPFFVRHAQENFTNDSDGAGRSYLTSHARTPDGVFTARDGNNYQLLAGKDIIKEVDQPTLVSTRHHKDTPYPVIPPVTVPVLSEMDYASTDISHAIRKLQSEVDSLRDVVGFYNKDNPPQLYERIDVKRNSTGHATPPSKRVAAAALDVGFIRLSFFVSDRSSLRRLFWLLILVVALGLLGLQLWDRISLFLVNTTVMSTETLQLESLAFPAVTICNLNTFRLTRLADAGLYRTIQQSLETGQLYYSDLTPKAQKILSLPYTDLLADTSHDKRDFIRRCVFRGKVCSHANFSDVITEYGRCYTFVPHEDVRNVMMTGPGSGLSLVINTEQYEYVLTGRSSVGVKITFHDPLSKPEIGVRGHNVPVGSHSFLSLTKKLVNDESNGCDPTIERNCVELQAQCEASLVAAKCHCSITGNTGSDQDPICNGRDYLTCMRKYIGRYQEPQPCSCASGCRRSKYTPFISEAASSVYAAESHVRALHSTGPALQERFHTARDLRQRIDPAIFSHDRESLSQILDSLNSSGKSIAKMATNLGALYTSNQASLNDVQGKLQTLNASVHVNYDSFKISSHASFYRHSQHLTDGLDKLIARESIINLVNIRNIPALNKNISDIITRLDRLAMSQAFNNFNPNDLLAEIKKKIKRFREDLLLSDGHGRFYREFKDSYDFYNQHTLRILNLTDTIRYSLAKNYDTLKTIQNLLTRNVNSDDLARTKTLLMKFFSSLKYLRHGSVKNIAKELQLVFDSYVVHKDHVIAFYKQIQSVLGSFIPRQRAISDTFATIKDVLFDLSTGYANIQKGCEKPGQLYSAGVIDKTELATAYLGSNTTSEIDQAQITLDRLEQSVNDLLVRSNVTDNTINVLLPRLKDFGLLRRGEEAQFSPRNFDNTAVTLLSLVSILAESLRQMRMYQGELSDYLRNGRINARFYQSNFLQINAYFRDLSETVETHKVSYGLIDLTCDIGGTLALYLGASLLTFVGLVDIILRIMCCPPAHSK